jgi:hypothetical protein
MRSRGHNQQQNGPPWAAGAEQGQEEEKGGCDAGAGRRQTASGNGAKRRAKEHNGEWQAAAVCIRAAKCIHLYSGALNADPDHNLSFQIFNIFDCIMVIIASIHGDYLKR